jgi:hypothetical protein
MTADMEKDLGTFIGEQNPFTEMRLPVWSKNSCGFAVVVFEQPTEPFSTLYWLLRTQVCVG